MVKLKDFETPAAAAGGGAFGLTTSEFFAEFFARVSAQTGWWKFGVKAITKIITGTIFYEVSKRMATGVARLFIEVASYAGWGSIFLDILSAWQPGGIAGMANVAAVKVRKAAVGAKAAAATMGAAKGAAPEMLAQTSGEGRSGRIGG